MSHVTQKKTIAEGGVLRPFSELKKQLLANPEVLAAYEEMAPEFELVKSIIELRKAHGMTQDDLAKAIGSKQPAIARIESGRYRGMSLSTLEKMAHALDARLVVRLEDVKHPRKKRAATA
jgi:DNA-binding XRE family transcriptional regulator